MRAVPSDPGSLAGAHERIAGLLDELNQTVDLVERLTRLGEHEAALRLVDEQRAALYSAIDEVSHGVGRPARWRGTLRRHATAGVAAAALLLSSLAVSVGLLNDGPSLIEQARAKLTEAQGVSDPVTRLRIIERVVEITRALPADSQEKADLAKDVLPALDDLKKDAEDGGDDGSQEDVVARADELAREVKKAAPTGEDGAPAPSMDQGPVDGFDEAADPKIPAPPGG